MGIEPITDTLLHPATRLASLITSCIDDISILNDWLLNEQVPFVRMGFIAVDLGWSLQCRVPGGESSHTFFYM